MRVLVTGAGGFLGGAIARRLSRRPELEVIEAVRRPAPNRPEALAFDLADPSAVRSAIASAQPDVVVHAAGRRWGAEVALERDNVGATLALAEALAAGRPQVPLIFIGSAAQYGPSAPGRRWREDDPRAPATAYGRAKEAAEQAVFATARGRGLPAASLRVFNVAAGSPAGGDVLSAFVREAAESMRSRPPPWRIQLGPLSAVRDFVWLDDVLEAVERTIASRPWGEAINLCTGVGRPVRELVTAIAAAVGNVSVAEPVTPEDGGLAWSVGDPGLLEARLGFLPSADLSRLVAEAADWIHGAGAPAHA